MKTDYFSGGRWTFHTAPGCVITVEVEGVDENGWAFGERYAKKASHSADRAGDGEFVRVNLANVLTATDAADERGA